jgi:hypothetical protein
MKKLSSLIVSILSLFFILSLSPVAMAYIDTPVPVNGGQSANPGITTYSYDSSFDLNFAQSQAWTLNFNNNSTLMFNHNNVEVKYLSNTPTTVVGQVVVELWIDEDQDGEYTKYDPNGGYTYTMNKADTIQIELPYGNTVKQYRLSFVNQTNSVTSAQFSVKTYR